MSLLVSLAVAWVISTMALYYLIDRAAAVRGAGPGLHPGQGPHRIWQLNVFDPKLYPSTARGFYRRLLLVAVANTILAVAFLALLVVRIAS